MVEAEGQMSHISEEDEWRPAWPPVHETESYGSTSFVYGLFAFIAGFSTFLFLVMGFAARRDIGIHPVTCGIFVLASICAILMVACIVVAIRTRNEDD